MGTITEIGCKPHPKCPMSFCGVDKYIFKCVNAAIIQDDSRANMPEIIRERTQTSMYVQIFSIKTLYFLDYFCQNLSHSALLYAHPVSYFSLPTIQECSSVQISFLSSNQTFQLSLKVSAIYARLLLSPIDSSLLTSSFL